MQLSLKVIVVVLLILAGAYEFQQAQQYKSQAESAETTLSPLELDLAKERELNRQMREQLSDEKEVAESAQKDLATTKLQFDNDEDQIAQLRTVSEKEHNELLIDQQKLGFLSPNINSRDTTGAASVATGYDPMKARAQNFLSFYKSLATVNGSKVQGSGFLAKFKDGTVLITNSHLLSNNQELAVNLSNGKAVDLQNISLADGYDVVEMHDVSLPEGLELATNLADSVIVGDEVAVICNGSGDGASSVVYGRIKSIGPKVLELSCSFPASASGSPVIQTKTGKVIGVATFELDLQDPSGSLNPSHLTKTERHLAYRLDNVPNWTTLDIPTFNNLGKTFAAVLSRTDDLLVLAKEFSPGTTLNYSHYYDDKNSLNDIVKSLEAASTGDLQSGLPETKDHLQEAQSSFLSDVIDNCTSDFSSINLDQFDGYHREVLAKQQKIRDALSNYFKDELNVVNAQTNH